MEDNKPSLTEAVTRHNADMPRTPPMPSLGRIVHFLESGELHAAFVTKVYEQAPTIVNLAVFRPDGTIYARTSVAIGTGEQTWRWPARV